MSDKPERVRAHVALSSSVDVARWRERYARGEVPDETPYGLHRLAAHAVDTSFRRAHTHPAVERVARSVRYRTDGYELVEDVLDLRARRRARPQVVIAYDERTSVPAALTAGRRVLAGVGWLTTRERASAVHARLAAHALARAGLVWAQCAPMLPLLGSEWGVAAERLRFVPFGIDTDFYAEQPWPAQPGVVVSAGEDPFRDHELLVSAVARVREHRPATRLELATGLPVTLPAELGVLYRERLDGRMRELYRRSTVVAVALRRSLTGSGLSVILEAMASGRPVVVTDNPGLDDYVQDGVTGLLVPGDDPAAFAEALDALLADPDRARAMGRAGAERVRAHFTSEHMSAELARLCRELVARRP